MTHVLLVGDGLAGESAGTEAPQVLPACCLRLFPARVFALFAERVHTIHVLACWRAFVTFLSAL